MGLAHVLFFLGFPGPYGVVDKVKTIHVEQCGAGRMDMETLVVEATCWGHFEPATVFTEFTDPSVPYDPMDDRYAHFHVVTSGVVCGIDEDQGEQPIDEDQGEQPFVSVWLAPHGGVVAWLGQGNQRIQIVSFDDGYVIDGMHFNQLGEAAQALNYLLPLTVADAGLLGESLNNYLPQNDPRISRLVGLFALMAETAP
jgi:hypothetical protein